MVAVSSFKFGPNGLEVDIIPGTDEVVPCDVVIFASGQKTDLTASFGLELNRLGYPVDPATGKSGVKTSLEGVFTAGDVVTGTKAVIDAIAGGRTAAETIDAYLGGDGNIEEHWPTCLLPTPTSARSRALPTLAASSRTFSPARSAGTTSTGWTTPSLRPWPSTRRAAA